MSIIAQLAGIFRAVVSSTPTQKGDLGCDVTTGRWSIYRAAAVRILEDQGNKSAANGYASLGASALVPTAELGTGSASSTTYLRGDQTWATVSGGGSVADGDYGDVTVSSSGTVWEVDQARGLRETAGPTTLTMGAVADGQVLRRSGSSIVGAYILMFIATPLMSYDLFFVVDGVSTPAYYVTSNGTIGGP